MATGESLGTPDLLDIGADEREIAWLVRFVAWRQGNDRPEAEAPFDLRPDLREAVSLPTEPMKSPPGLMVFASFVPADTVYELEWYDGCDDSPHREGPKRIRPE